jgi:hypothetical protein
VFHGAARGELLAPYRTLALRVISLAVRDLMTPGHSIAERKTARDFLSGSRMLNHWCKLADIDPEAIRKQVHAVAEDSHAEHPRRRH